jgi:hypothetical protein
MLTEFEKNKFFEKGRKEADSFIRQAIRSKLKTTSPAWMLAVPEEANRVYRLGILDYIKENHPKIDIRLIHP